MIINNLSETKKYEIVYVDPPWKKKKGGLRKSRPNQTRDLDYKTLSNDEIKNIISKIQVEKNIISLCGPLMNSYLIVKI